MISNSLWKERTKDWNTTENTKEGEMCSYSETSKTKMPKVFDEKYNELLDGGSLYLKYLLCNYWKSLFKKN